MASDKLTREFSAESREKMARAAKARHARDRAARRGLPATTSQDDLTQSMLGDLNLPVDLGAVYDVVNTYVSLLDAPKIYAIYLLRSGAVRKHLDGMLTGDTGLAPPARVKVLALLHEMAESEVRLAKELDIPDAAFAERRIKELVQIVLDTTPPEVRQELAEAIRRSAVLCRSIT